MIEQIMNDEMWEIPEVDFFVERVTKKYAKLMKGMKPGEYDDLIDINFKYAIDVLRQDGSQGTEIYETTLSFTTLEEFKKNFNREIELIFRSRNDKIVNVRERHSVNTLYFTLRDTDKQQVDRKQAKFHSWLIKERFMFANRVVIDLENH